MIPINNPWTEINLDTYEKHMSLDNINQLQTMNLIMKDQFNSYPAESVMILGIAGGNGLEHIDPQKIKNVYGVDINEKYLSSCKERYEELRGVLTVICADLTCNISLLPHADLICANLLIEYIGYECFAKVIRKVEPQYVSCVIQVNGDKSFVSDSPFIHEFDRLGEVLHQTREDRLSELMKSIGYKNKCCLESGLPDGKKLVRTDFVRNNLSS